MDKLVFIIAQKYYRNYPSYIEYYIDNIQTNYPKSLIIVVDNNSTHKDDVFSSLSDKDKVVLLDNNIDCKFEIGAYKVAMDYMITENIVDDYEYFIFTQDNFILKNKFDFNILKFNNVTACPLVSLPNDWEYWYVCEPILNMLGLNSHIHETRLCWCSSFILEKNNIEKMLDFFKNITIVNRVGSMASERYLGRLLWELNDRKHFDIDGDVNNLSYYCHTVDAYSNINNFFCKISQQKNENTLEI
jgi:hypothetical protein